MNFRERFLVKPGKGLDLADHDPDSCAGMGSKADADKHLEKYHRRLADLQELLYAENKRSLLVVLQAMDAGGKDGTIRHVMSSINPQSCRVTSFKAPTPEELAHDFLWRIHKAVPRRGEIGIFNRSHYEDVLVVRVHELVP
jgi:polyphosphate kinase 2 (PPK2 family)